MTPRIEATRFDRFYINVYQVSGTTYLVCGRRGETEDRFTRVTSQKCHCLPDGLILTLQRQLWALQRTSDFQEWFQLVYGNPWGSDNSCCPLCFIAFRQLAEELRNFMGAEYDPFLTATLNITVCDVPTEPTSQTVEPSPEHARTMRTSLEQRL